MASPTFYVSSTLPTVVTPSWGISCAIVGVLLESADDEDTGETKKMFSSTDGSTQIEIIWNLGKKFNFKGKLLTGFTRPRKGDLVAIATEGTGTAINLIVDSCKRTRKYNDASDIDLAVHIDDSMLSIQS